MVVCGREYDNRGVHALEKKDQVTKLVEVEVFLDFRYGLLLTELAIRTCLEWLGVTVQPRVLAVALSPVKPRADPTSGTLKRGRGVEIDVDESYVEQHPGRPLLMNDVSGQPFVV